MGQKLPAGGKPPAKPASGVKGGLGMQGRASTLSPPHTPGPHAWVPVHEETVNSGEVYYKKELLLILFTCESGAYTSQ